MYVGNLKINKSRKLSADCYLLLHFPSYATSMSGLRSRHAFLFRSHSCWYVFPLVPQTGRFTASRHPVHAHLALPFPFSMQTLPEGQTFLSHGFAAKKREFQGNNKDHYVRIIVIISSLSFGIFEPEVN